MSERNRRSVLRWVGLGLLGGSTGCVSDYGAPSPEDMPTTTTTTTTRTTTATTTTTTETTTTRTPRPEPASFEMVGMEMLETVQIGESFELTVTMENVGGQSGTFTTPLYYKTPDTDWQEAATWTFENVPPGETVTKSRKITFDYLAEVTVRLSGYEPRTIRVLPPKMGLGERYTTPGQFEMTVDAVELRNAIEFDTTFGESEQRRAGAGKVWAIVDVRVKNESAKPAIPPGAETFKLLSGNRQYEPHSFVFEEPLADPGPYRATELHPGIVREGWIIYQVPAGLRRTEVTVAWSDDYRDGTVAVYWSVQ